MDDMERLERAQEALGYTFQHPEVLYQSLRHPSSTDQRLDSCERMEFLGDAILGMVVVDYLYRTFGSMEEGEMTKIKSAVVSRASCAVVAARVGLGELVILGKGMIGRRELPQSVLASVYESVVGALYLDGCGGMTAPIIGCVDALFNKRRLLPDRICFGYTLTEAEPTGRSLADREVDVNRAVMAACRSHSYQLLHVSDDPERFGVDPNTLKREGGTMTSWLVLERGHA